MCSLTIAKPSIASSGPCAIVAKPKIAVTRKIDSTRTVINCLVRVILFIVSIVELFAFKTVDPKNLGHGFALFALLHLIHHAG